jgi:hypothetical protein
MMRSPSKRLHSRLALFFGINEQNGLQHVYWGKRIERAEDFSAKHTTTAFSCLLAFAAP